MLEPIVIKTKRHLVENAILRTLPDADQATKDYVARWAGRIQARCRQRRFEDSTLNIHVVPTD